MTQYSAASVINHLSDFVLAVLIYIAASFIIHCFYDDAVEIDRRKILFHATVCYISEALKFFFGWSWLGIVIYLSVGIMGAWGCKDRKIRRGFKTVLTAVLCALNGMILAQMCIYCAGMEGMMAAIEDEDIVGRFNFTNLVAIFFTLMIILYLMRQYIRRGRTMPFRTADKVYAVLYCIYMIAIEVAYITLERDRPTFSAEYQSVRVMMSLVCIAIAVMMPMLILRNRQTDYFNKLSEQHRTFLEAELAASKQFKEAQEETRAFRHDVRNNLSVVSMLMNEGKFEEARQFIDDMHTQVSSLSPKIVTGDEMLDSLIASKMAKMTEEGINFTINGVADGGIGWKPIDICTVFANAIDNAIEACMRTDVSAERFIRLEIRKTAHQRLITLSNSSPDGVDCEKLMQRGVHLTSKADKQLHGYGVGNILRTVEKYGGMTRLSCEDGIFKLEMILGIDI